MSSAKHEKSFVDFEKPYEQNVIGLKGIIYFGVGLLLLIVITFALMWALNGVLEENAQETKSSNNPMAFATDRERLPPEPRLQAAPGFSVDGPNGRVNLELMAPQAEYLELRKQWETAWREGTKDAKTGTVISLPIERAKEMVLQGNIKARTGPEAEHTANASRMVINDSSSGRMATIKRR
jgi:hypothetical protein